ncbi:MAG: SUF system NifU family Fe-S cluster assembly protein [Candidatus Aenigmatarchaeota archaeon]|nr:MAG: SUF system NifU family Fe-S cluster assembly protein [Candidatus Aenigmarchaeota archaeon]
MSSQMYQENVLDHYRHPRNKGALTRPDIKHSGQNPLCGDEIEIMAKLNGDVIKDVRFRGSGCAISQAAASMLTERIKGMALADVKRIERDDVVSMLGVPISATRMKCAMLGLVTMKHGILAHEGARVPKTTTEDVPGEGA